MKFQNPILPGFNPDPSICYHVDTATFFIVTSSFHMFPGLPIYASKDLQTWTQIGNAIHRSTQIDLGHATTTSYQLGADRGTMIATKGLWAPTIRYHPGTDKFYITCTNTFTSTHFLKKNFIVSTPAPLTSTSTWSDPTYFDFNGIDPSLFFDHDDATKTWKNYLVGPWSYDRKEQPSCTMKIFEIDLDTGKHLSEEIELWEGHLRHDPEGPHIYKKDGYYYLLIADGGTFSHHSICIARSRGLLGPYESCPQNPILTAWETQEYVQNTGHGDLVQDGAGKWWCVCLGIRNESDGTRVPLGRESFLTPVEWEEGEWPVIAPVRMEFDRNTSTVNQNDSGLSVSQNAEYLYIRNPVATDYRFSDVKGSVEMKCSANDLSADKGTTSFLGLRQANLTCVTSVSIDQPSQIKGIDCRAGLAVYKDSWRYAKIFVDFEQSVIGLEVRSRGDDKLDSAAEYITLEHITLAANICLKIEATKTEYAFCYNLDGNDWRRIGVVDTNAMTALDFTGTIIGIFAEGKESRVGTAVNFESFIQEVLS